MERRIGHVNDIPTSDALIIELEGRPIGVFRRGEKFFAVRNLCPHKRAPLAMGTVEGTMLPTPCAGELQYGMENQVIRCPWHGWEFDLETGKCLFGVSDTKIKIYPVSVRGDDVYIEI